MQISFFETYGGLQSVSGDLRRLPPSCDDRLRMNSSVDQFFGLAKKLGREDDDGRGAVTDLIVLLVIILTMII